KLRPARQLVVLEVRHGGRMNVEVSQQRPRPPRVLTRNDIHLFEDPKPAQRDVFEVPDRGGDDVERSAHTASSAGFAGAILLCVLGGGTEERVPSGARDDGRKGGEAPLRGGQAVCSLASETRTGRSRLRMTSRVMTHSLSPWIEGSSYMISSMTSSRIARRPRAPVPRLSASLAIAATASSVNLRRTFSRSKYFWYCLVIAFLGSLRIRTSAASSRSCSVAITGRRPTNSGMRP